MSYNLKEYKIRLINKIISHGNRHNIMTVNTMLNVE